VLIDYEILHNHKYNKGENMLNCIVCSKELEGRQTKFCSVKCKQSDINIRHQNYVNQEKRGYDNKRKLLEYKGYKCSECGYDKNSAALCFHHLRDKKFQLDIRKCSNTKWETLVEEANKCIVLCHNCHMETHHPEHQLVRHLGFDPSAKDL
jgi:hypothetical protein